jgi:RNA polymerase sigma-70 factor (ECF subfamily)
MQRELVLRAIDGDHGAFTELVDASVDRQYLLATLILHDGDHARDAVQEALVSAWRDIRSLRDPGAWDPWLHRLTVWACYRLARKERRRRLVELHVRPGPEPVDAMDPLVALAERDRIERRLAALPIDQRAIIVLHFDLDLPLPDAAAILGIPVGTAKSRLHRGLEGLRRVMLAEQDPTALAEKPA